MGEQEQINFDARYQVRQIVGQLDRKIDGQIDGQIVIDKELGMASLIDKYLDRYLVEWMFSQFFLDSQIEREKIRRLEERQIYIYSQKVDRKQYDIDSEIDYRYCFHYLNCTKMFS